MTQQEIFAPAPPPRRRPKAASGEVWRPRLGPIGYEVLRARSVPGKPQDTLVKLLYGEKASGKTNIALHDLVTHCYLDVLKPVPGKRRASPLAVICTIFRAGATDGGAWDKLVELVLPEWYDGMGLDFTEPKMDMQKNWYLDIGNIHGGWSRVILKSIPWGENIKNRLYGMEFSYYLSEEIALTDGPSYFFVPLQQCRRPTGTSSIFMATCNPADQGEENWVWKHMVVTPCKTAGNEAPEMPAEKKYFRKDMGKYAGGKLGGMEPKFSVYHIPAEENVNWTPEQIKANQENVLAECRFDRTAIDRLIKGIWTARPTGEGIFKEFFIPSVHIKGDVVAGTGILPKPHYPIIIGYDIGQVHHSIDFLQRIPTENGNMWINFDEIFIYQRRILYKSLAIDIIRHMRWWREKVGFNFPFIHITDESAIDQWRPGSGSYDALIFENEYNKYQKEFGSTDEQIKLLGCPKGSGSIAARTTLLQARLHEQMFFASATCPNTKSMLMFLEADKKKPDVPKETSKWTHKFDSLTYPIFKFEVTPGNIVNLPTAQVAPSLISCGV
jgi:hypothetical protein